MSTDLTEADFDTEDPTDLYLLGLHCDLLLLLSLLRESRFKLTIPTFIDHIESRTSGMFDSKDPDEWKNGPNSVGRL